MTSLTANQLVAPAAPLLALRLFGEPKTSTTLGGEDRTPSTCNDMQPGGYVMIDVIPPVSGELALC